MLEFISRKFFLLFFFYCYIYKIEQDVKGNRHFVRVEIELKEWPDIYLRCVLVDMAMKYRVVAKPPLLEKPILVEKNF